MGRHEADAVGWRSFRDDVLEGDVERIRGAEPTLNLVEAGLNCEHGDLAVCPRFQAVLAQRFADP